MFRLLDLSLHGWDLWPAVRIPLDSDIVLVTGPNGSGKTTLLDALRQLMNAPRLSSRRRLQHYLRSPGVPALLWATVSNEGGPGTARPFARDWMPSMAMSTSVVPWLGLWLIHYEGWRATGHWEGGGVPHGPHRQAPEEAGCRSG